MDYHVYDCEQAGGAACDVLAHKSVEIKNTRRGALTCLLTDYIKTSSLHHTAHISTEQIVGKRPP